ncbi:hypothetical protein [Plantactinospora sp. GCM10030261]|uniref:hypothetical protein n=1 Tax=Plantactinospora sp. GCM10030261 TaxID=3273420 RepID=UPI0036202CFD
MTERLREVLRRTAEDVPTYPVYERALATARRTRRRLTAASLAAVAGLALLGTTLPAIRPASIDPAAASEAALPDRIGPPALGSLHATDRPRLGPASVIFSGTHPRLRFLSLLDNADFGVVGATSDRYRLSGANVPEPVAGEGVILSPDGRWIASPGHGEGIELVDLDTGRTRALDSGVAGSVGASPLGWAPDGARLVVLATVPVDAARSGFRDALSLVSPDGGQPVRLAVDVPSRALDISAAFAPDGGRLAVQVGETVTITDVDGARLASFRLPAETALAGKGAWTADGSALTAVSRRPGTTTWGLRRIDPAAGRDQGPLPLPEVSDVTTIRLLGWRPDGAAVVVAYQPEPASGERFDAPMAMDDRTWYGNVRTVRVVALASGAAAPATLLTAPEQVQAIDVADAVIRGGRVRVADPPSGVGGRFWWWVGVGSLVASLVLARRMREDHWIRRARGSR